MKSKEEIREWLLNNCVDEAGDLDLAYLDLSEFKGNVLIHHMKVGKSLYQNRQEVEDFIEQSNQTVNGDLWQDNQKVKGSLYQDEQLVNGNLWQGNQNVKGEIK